jgi:hypothetical protein
MYKKPFVILMTMVGEFCSLFIGIDLILTLAYSSLKRKGFQKPIFIVWLVLLQVIL